MRACLKFLLACLWLLGATPSMEAAVGATVNSTADHPASNPAISPLSTLGSGIVTLRSAIQYANASATFLPGDTIAFNIPGSGVHRIQPGGVGSPTPGVQLDTITKELIIDGYSQPGTSKNSLVVGNNANLSIMINGSDYTVGDGLSYDSNFGSGLTFSGAAAGSLVQGLILNQWIGAGIRNATSGEIQVIGNFVGTDSTGMVQMANGSGVVIAHSNGSFIGTTPAHVASPLPSERNIIAGSFADSSAGIVVVDSSNVTIKNNYIGLDKNGTSVLGNSQMGIDIFGAFSTNTNIKIGGSTAAERNVISGHTIGGIVFLYSAHNCTVQGNYLGTDATGEVALSGLEGKGVLMFGNGGSSSVSDNTIENNVISGWDTGIMMGFSQWNVGVNHNNVQGNFIGTDASGLNPLPNRDGIIVNDNDNVIGLNPSAPLANQGNVLSGNLNTGLTIYGAQGTVVQGNHIGVDLSNKIPLGNGYAGIQLGRLGLSGPAMDNFMGGVLADQGNFIGANGCFGISIESYSTGNTIRGNCFGTRVLVNGQENIRILCSDGNIIISN